MMTSRHHGLIRVARERLGMAEEDYRALLKRVAGVESATNLDWPGFDRLMAEFRRLGFRSDWYGATGGYRVGMASPAQLGLIGRLWAEWTDGEGTENGLCTWMEKKFRVSALRFLEAERARQVITALSAMVKRKRGRGVKQAA